MGIVPKGVDEKKMESKSSSDESKYYANKGTCLSWAHYFESGVGDTKKYQVKSMLAYRLSYLVFPYSPEDGLNNFVFALTVLLVKGDRLALAPLSLGFLFDRLDECTENMVQSVRWYDVAFMLTRQF